MRYTEKLFHAIKSSNSSLCVGLDPNLELLPDSINRQNNSPPKKVEIFLKTVIDLTKGHCAAYKPNLGFFEALGADSWDIFEEIIDYIPSEKIIIADAKRGDISSTADHYAKAFFNRIDVDAITLNPLMGFETLEPFLNDESKCSYVLTLTSNPGAKDILLRKLSDGQTISAYISKQLSIKQEHSATSIGMVVGATNPKALEPVIKHFPGAPLLIPGVGKQGGSVSDLSKVLDNHRGIPLVNSSRSIIYAGNKSENWQQSVQQSAKNFKDQLASITKNYV